MNLQNIVYLSTLCLLPLASAGVSQGLFESADAGTAEGTPLSYELGGYVKAGVYSGSAENEVTEIKAGRGEISLKLEAKKAGLGKAFTDIRLEAGFLNREKTYDVDVREAWVQTETGPFFIKAGQQVIVWGRADGINPTNNITPSDKTVFSSETDDTRLSNFLINAELRFGMTRLEALWIPVYKPDALPTDIVPLPPGLSIGATNYPDFDISNGSYALRMNLEFPAIDGSISYFNGYATQPAFDFSVTQSSLDLLPVAYRIHAVGTDFSSSVGSFGIRGEAAFKISDDDYEKKPYLPNPHFQYVLGIDKTFLDFEMLVQYSGKTILDFEKCNNPSLSSSRPDSAELQSYRREVVMYQMKSLNRLFVEQRDEVSHTVTLRISRPLLHETLKPEIAAMYNFTTEEYIIRPCISYDIADALVVSAGGQYLDGPDESLFGLTSNPLSYAFIELKCSF